MNQPTAPATDPRYRLWSLLALLAIALMDGALTTMWYRALIHPAGVPWSELLAVVLLILVGSQALSAITARLKWPLWVRQALFLAWLVAILLGSMKALLFAHEPVTVLEMILLPVRYINLAEGNPASFIHILFILVLIWRGVSLARGSFSPKTVSVNFQLGLIFVLLYGMFYAPRYPEESSAGLYLYLFSGLIALSATRITSLSDLRGGRMPQFNSVWLASTFGSALLVVAVAVLLGWASSTQLVAWAIKIMAFIFTVLAALLTLLLQPLARLLWGAIPNIMQALNGVLKMFSGIRLPKFLEDIVVNLDIVLSQVAPAVVFGRKVFMVALIIVIALAVLLGLRLIRRIRPAQADDESANTERTSLKDLLRRFSFRQRRAGAGRRYSASQLLAAARIRQVYSQLMALSQRLGLARPPASTPLEFLPQLQTLFAQESEGVQHITQAYVKVRYGEYPESNQEVDEVLAAWERVKKHGRALARKHKDQQKSGS